MIEYPIYNLSSEQDILESCSENFIDVLSAYGSQRWADMKRVLEFLIQFPSQVRTFLIFRGLKSIFASNSIRLLNF
jgi:hypothetical protein